MVNTFKITGIVFFVLGLFSCDGNKVFEEYIEVEKANWQRENVASFKFIANDTINPHNLYLNIRNTGDYKYSNIYLFVTMKGPNGGLLKDTVNCVLADNRGKWLGNGIGDLWDLRIPYIRAFKFAQSGEYTVSLEQAMRVEDGLKGITDVGLRVETAE